MQLHPEFGVWSVSPKAANTSSELEQNCCSWLQCWQGFISWGFTHWAPTIRELIPSFLSPFLIHRKWSQAWATWLSSISVSWLGARLMVFKHLESTVTHDWGLRAADHEGSWKQEQFAYNDKQERSRCFLYTVESFNLNSLAFFPLEGSQPKREPSTTVSDKCLWGQEPSTHKKGFFSLSTTHGRKYNFIIGLT